MGIMLLFEGPPELVAVRLTAFSIAAAGLVLLVIGYIQFGYPFQTAKH